MIAQIPLSTVVTVPFDDQRLRSLRKPRQIRRVPRQQLDLSWGEVLRGAILCGVSGWQARRRHGLLGRHEIRRRALHILSHLEVRTTGLHEDVFRSAIYETEDGSEKTASSYLIGMAMALATCRATGTAHALLHFDGVHGAFGTRPDLVAAAHPASRFVEVKGRFKMVGQPAMDSAVRQLATHRLRSQTAYAAAIATGFRSGRLQVHRQWYVPAKLTTAAFLAALGDDSADVSMRQWEPLTLAIWYAGLQTSADRAGWTVIEGVPFVHVELRDLRLLVGMAAPVFDRVTELLRHDDVLPYDVGADPREAGLVPLSSLEDRYVVDDLMIAWTPGTGAD